MVFNEYDAILLFGPTAVEIPAGSDGLLMKRTEEGLFDMIRDGHVILDGVEATEDNIE
jgi:hypothetical protein